MQHIGGPAAERVRSLIGRSLTRRDERTILHVRARPPFIHRRIEFRRSARLHIARALDPARVDVDRARPMRQHIGGDARLGERLARQHDRLMRRLERRVPSLPALRRIGRRDVRSFLVIAARHRRLDPRPRRAVRAIRAILSASGRCGVAYFRRIDPDRLALRAQRAVNPLRHVMRLRKAGAVEPLQLVADFKAGVFYCDNHAMIGARAGKRRQMAARFQHAQRRAPCLDTKGDIAAIPCLAHEAARRS